MMSECPHAKLVLNEVLSDGGHVMLDFGCFWARQDGALIHENEKTQLN